MAIAILAVGATKSAVCTIYERPQWTICNRLRPDVSAVVWENGDSHSRSGRHKVSGLHHLRAPTVDDL